MSRKAPTFEEKLAQLQSLVEEMEGGSIPLDASMKRYEEGIRLVNELEQELGQAKQRLTVLRRTSDGEPFEEPVQPGPEGEE